MKTYNYKKILVMLLCTAVVSACTKKLDVLDDNNPTTESYFKTASELQNGVNAVYSILRAGELTAREWYTIHDMRGGEFAAGGPQLEAPRAELNNQPAPSATNSVIGSVWSGC